MYIGVLRLIVTGAPIHIENTDGFYAFGANEYFSDIVMEHVDGDNIVDAWRQYYENKTIYYDDMKSFTD